MKEKLMKFGLSPFKVILTTIFCMAALLSIIYVALTSNELFSYCYCLAIFIFVQFPMLLSIIFKWKMNTYFYILFTFYAFGPLLGAVYKLYYYTFWWDLLLHLLSGLIFAVVGTKLTKLLNNNNETSVIFAAIFGVTFSIVIAVFWEIFEFSSDVLLGSDMQADTIINTINTRINNSKGIITKFLNISETIVNGKPLGIEGYLDIGLIDTMTDMLFGVLGSVIYFIYMLINKNNCPIIISLKNNKN